MSEKQKLSDALGRDVLTEWKRAALTAIEDEHLLFAGNPMQVRQIQWAICCGFANLGSDTVRSEVFEHSELKSCSSLWLAMPKAL
jgi:hypothetical protein